MGVVNGAVTKIVCTNQYRKQQWIVDDVDSKLIVSNLPSWIKLTMQCQGYVVTRKM